ncbi:copper/iron-regulated glutamine amidotransferase [Aspergillus stella-maris]|uniref:copper/iron-regulated glutamine amidotransferase n=1 Tax=Aspergillus stella-maris TaxID=1810926 RepID=UPI003CCE3F8A
MPHVKGFNVAILVNEGSKGNIPMKVAFEIIFKTISPESQLNFYDPVHAQSYPDVSKYDLIVLSGGSVFVMEEIPWVMKMRSFIRSTIAEHPQKKILGICWGHQIINVALGGRVQEMGSAKIGVQTVPLTKAGSVFLGDALLQPGQINIQKFHKRDVAEPVVGFTALADNNEAFVNLDNTILTFQGHPEMNVEWGSEAAAGFPAYVTLTGYSMEEIQEHIRRPTDGEAIWRRVLRWVEE